jgi:hypothetical protein
MKDRERGTSANLSALQRKGSGCDIRDRRGTGSGAGLVAGAPTRPAAPPGRDASGHNATTSALCRSSITKCFGISKGRSASQVLHRKPREARAKRMCGPSQLGVCTVTSPWWSHLLQRVRRRNASLDVSGLVGPAGAAGPLQSETLSSRSIKRAVRQQAA